MSERSAFASIALCIGILSGIVGLFTGIRALVHKDPIADLDGYWTSSIDGHVLRLNLVNSTGHPIAAQVTYPCATLLGEKSFNSDPGTSEWDGHKLWVIYRHKNNDKFANLILKATLVDGHLVGIVRDATALSVSGATEADDPNPILVNIDLRRGEYPCTQPDLTTKLP